LSIINKLYTRNIFTESFVSLEILNSVAGIIVRRGESSVSLEILNCIAGIIVKNVE